jgi:hypothetical protein
MKNKVKKKPTAKEMASAIIEINGKTNELYKVLKDIDGILGLYIEMKGDKDKFNVFLKEKHEEYERKMKEENDKKANGKADKEDIPANPDNKRSGTEGIRKES